MTDLRRCLRLLLSVAVVAASFALPAGGAQGAPESFRIGTREILRTPSVVGWPEHYPDSAKLLDAEDRVTFKEAYNAAVASNWPRARQYGERLRNVTARKFIQWAFLTADRTEPRFEEVVAFIEANPDWPSQDTLLRKAEEALPDFMPPAQLIAWFAGQEPVTGEGKLRLGKAMVATGQAKYGTTWIQRGFVEHDYTDSRQKEIYDAYKQYLDRETIEKRLDRLLWTSQTTQAAWLAQFAGPQARRLAETRIALMRSAGNALTLLGQLSADERKSPGVLFDETRYHRRRGNDVAAQRTLTSLVGSRDMPYPEKWWIERHLQARKALEERNYQTAYDLASRHGLDDGSGFADGEFLAGWIALRFLNKPKLAYDHFQRLNEGVGYPISLSRARYWMGRAAEAQGDIEAAKAAYLSATDFPYTFYGQLAAERGLLPNQRLALPAEAPVAIDLNDPFFRQELIVALRLLNEIGGEQYMRTIAYHLAGDERLTREQLVMLAELMRRIGHEAVAVRVAKKASQRHLLLTDYLFPLVDLPNYAGRGTPPEPALVLGLSRQESEFNPKAVSGAGARGLMQLMPSTARITANKHGLPYSTTRLTEDPTYNMQLGMAHLGDLLERFNGSYVLIIAAYNAGPSRAQQWVDEIGDPRLPSADVVDWIESIPFGETRNYVQRVLENAMVYRHRIAGRPVDYAVSTDLRRTSATPVDLSYTKAGPVASAPAGKPAQAEAPKPAPRIAENEPAPSMAEAEAKLPPQVPEATAPAPTAQVAPEAGETKTEISMSPIPDAPAPAIESPASATPIAGAGDYLPPNTPVLPPPALSEAGAKPAESASAGTSTAAPAPTMLAPQPTPEADRNADKTVPPPVQTDPDGWQIPLDCVRFEIDASGVGRCLD